MVKKVVVLTGLVGLLAAGSARAEEGGFGSYLNEREGKSAPVKAAQVEEKEEKAEQKTKAKKEKKKKKKSAEAAESSQDSAKPAARDHSPAPVPQAAVAPAERNVASSATPSPFRFGAFADLRYTKVSAHNDATIPNANAESGFGLEDAAIFGNYDQGKLSVVLDLAFRRGKDKDTNAAAAIGEQSQNANFGIGVDKSQLYAKYKFTDSFAASLGQFDTLFGVELNDSKDRVFGKTGLLYDQTLPVTHTGAMVEFATHGAYAKAFGANPNNKGSRGSNPPANDDRTEFGGALGYSNDMLRGQLGYMTRKITPASGTGRKQRNLADLTLGTTLGAFALDLEYAQVSDPTKNVFTTANANDLEPKAKAMLAMATYRIVEPLLLGVRYEAIRKVAFNGGTTAVDKGSSIGGSVHYRVSPELEMRAEYIGYRFTGIGTPAAKWNASRANVAAVVTF